MDKHEDVQELINRLRLWATLTDKGSIKELLLDSASKLNEMATICAEVYQVVGSLADDFDVFDHPKVIKVLDNLASQELMHNDILPFPSFEGE